LKPHVKNILIEALTLLVLLSLISCGSGKKTVDKTVTEQCEKKADNMIWDMDVEITDKGLLKARMHAGYLERDNFANNKYAVSSIDSGMAIDFFDKGKNTGRLTSVKGNMNDLSEIFVAMDDVVFSSNKGYVLYTDTLTWNRRNAQIFTESDVMMIKDGRDTLYGDGFTSDDRLESYEIKKPRGKTLVEDEGVKK
jgi:LPS export ABC transporter protein LptC